MPLHLTRRTLLRGGAASAALTLMPFAAHALQVEAAEGLSFLAIGDWGVAGSAGERQVADAMEEAAAERSARFVVALGDNFYESGVASVEDPLWQKAFEEVFTGEHLRCPWYAVLGNHDHKGSTEAELGYGRIDPRWIMPARYYARSEPVGDGESADFFFLDTQPLATQTLFGSVFWPFGVADQLGWLDDGLARSNARWKIVVGHHPVFSGGRHGTSPAMIRNLKPILDRHRVTAYLSGHDHSLQHIEVDGVRYLTSGAGAKLSAVAPIEGTLFGVEALGFLAVDIRADGMDATFIGADGRILHSANIAPRDPSGAASPTTG